ncbi:hypothetical protein AAGS39_09990 [Flavobacterium sp. CGRL2]
MKILEVFPDVDLYWILIGRGNFPKNDEVVISETKIISPISNENLSQDLFSEIKFDENEKAKTKDATESKTSNLNVADNEIEKIVFFYKNGTFKTYSP